MLALEVQIFNKPIIRTHLWNRFVFPWNNAGELILFKHQSTEILGFSYNSQPADIKPSFSTPIKRAADEVSPAVSTFLNFSAGPCLYSSEKLPLINHLRPFTIHPSSQGHVWPCWKHSLQHRALPGELPSLQGAAMPALWPLAFKQPRWGLYLLQQGPSSLQAFEQLSSTFSQGIQVDHIN